MTKELVKSSWDNNYYGHFLHTLSTHKTKIVRILEKMNKNLTKHSLSITFNEICIKELLIPINMINV